MGKTVFVKVVGFRDAERHALNTLFRVAVEQSTCYALWTPESPVMPHIALIDVESYAAGMALASPGLNPNLKLICIGNGAPARAWRVFSRPINWSAILHAMEQLFANHDVDINIAANDHAATVIPPGVRQSLLVEPVRDDRLYLRARLALAGLIDVDEVESCAHALNKLRERHYDVAVVSVDMLDDPWALVQRMVSAHPPVESVVVTSSNRSWAMHERTEQAGCRALLDKPFDPSLVYRVFQMV
ncbi:MAG: response regulator [Betaproteobacteria bacterium]